MQCSSGEPEHRSIAVDCSQKHVPSWPGAGLFLEQKLWTRAAVWALLDLFRERMEGDGTLETQGAVPTYPQINQAPQHNLPCQGPWDAFLSSLCKSLISTHSRGAITAACIRQDLPTGESDSDSCVI